MSHEHHFTTSTFWISGLLFLVGLAYLGQWIRIASAATGGVKGWRVCSFFVGIFAVWVALGTSLSVLDHQSLTAHMIQHLLLMTLAPPLILLGEPWKALRQTRLHAVLDPAFGWGPMRHLLNTLFHPVFGWLSATATLIVWHIPAVFAIALRSEIWHGVEQASFFATGMLFWWPVVGPSRNRVKWPESSTLLYLFLATLPCDILSGLLVFCGRVVYPVFVSSPQSPVLSALDDQQCAGALMWTCVTIVYLIAGTIFTARLLSPHWSKDHLMLRLPRSQRAAE